MGAREKLDEFVCLRGLNTQHSFGWSVIADFAEWYADERDRLNCQHPYHSIIGEDHGNPKCLKCGKILTK